MDFCINKNYFGTDFHIVCRESGETEKLHEESLPEGMLEVYSGQARDIASLYGFKIHKFPSYKYRKFFVQYSKNAIVPWQHVLPKNVYVKEVKRFVKDLKENIHSIKGNYYFECFLPQNQIFKELQPAKINVETFMNLMHEKHDSHLKTFAPTRGYAPVVRYSRFSKTGRLKVISGPRINNLLKEHRCVLESRFRGGSIYQFDFSSLEPRIFLAIKKKSDSNIEIPKDIYHDFVEKNNLFEIPRAVLKNAILSRMFGAGNNLIEDNLRTHAEYPEDVVSMIDEYLGVEELKTKILAEFESNSGKNISNFYGRPVDCEDASPHSLLNYYVQSTAVDVCLFGFNEIIKRLKLAGLLSKIVPIFILHDALFLDIHPDYKYLIDKLCKAGSKNIPKFEGVDFCLKADKLI